MKNVLIRGELKNVIENRIGQIKVPISFWTMEVNVSTSQFIFHKNISETASKVKINMDFLFMDYSSFAVDEFFFL